MKEFKSFYKMVGGGEGENCNYSVRLDTYGCGCENDCAYCYAKSLLEFRGLWNAKKPAVGEVSKISKEIRKIPKGTIIRLGGMTDCFQSAEKLHRTTYKTIRLLNKRNIGYLIVTKSPIIAEKEYIDVMDKKLAHIQFTLTFTDDELYKRMDIEKAPLPGECIRSIFAPV